MSDIHWQQVETILDKALDLPKDRRQEFIETECRGKPKLKGEVTQLLDSIFDSEGWLENPEEYKRDMYDEMADDVQLLSSGESLVGTKIGSYLISEKIGEGGMGTVYLAKHSTADIDHKVAIKIIRSGKATEQNIQRFKREQQILAGLRHPGIAQLYDAGTTGDGFPYIIMEYVDGIPITDYCHQHNCRLDQKLGLFGDVLQAVQYAHESLVIHRDLKPANILVDQSGNTKILDFGISKLLEDEQVLSLTRTGTRLLTPRYAAPEQVRQDNVTTATDLYALGIVFYKLLSGQYPLDFDELTQYEIEQAILNQEADKPSIKVSDSKTKKQLQGDLDAIALKAIRKEKDQRYRVANEFWEDLKSYEEGIPVSAAEDSFKYRSRKFFKRHKQGIAVAAGILLLLIGLTGFYTWQIAQERNRAELEAQKAEQVSEFLLNLFEANDPNINQGGELTAKELLDLGLSQSENMQNEYVRADMLEVIGQAYEKLGFQQKSEDILDRSIKIHSTLYDSTSLEMASVLFKRGAAENLNYDIALPYFKKSYEIYQTNTYKKPLKQAEVAEKLAYSYRHAGKLDSAEFFARKSLELLRLKSENQNSTSFINSKATLAYVLRKKGELEKAKQLYLEVISQSKSEMAEPTSLLATYYNNIAFIFYDQKDFEQAAHYLAKSLKINEKILGAGHRTTLMVRSNLASVKELMSKKKETENLYRDNIKYAEEYYSEDDWNVGEYYGVLGFFLTKEGRYTEAEPMFRKSANIYKKSLGEKHIWTTSEYNKLAINLFLQGKNKEANQLFENYYPFLKSKAPDFRQLNINQIKDLIGLCKIDSLGLSEQLNKYQKLISIAQK